MKSKAISPRKQMAMGMKSAVGKGKKAPKKLKKK